MSFYAGQSREALRETWREAWRRWRERLPLQPLDMQIAQVVDAHPEYQRLVESPAGLERDFPPDGGQENPFLHMGLHLALHEQLRTNRPAGVVGVYQHLLVTCADAHAAEHRMIEVLAAVLWEAQRHRSAPDEQAYLQRLRAL